MQEAAVAYKYAKAVFDTARETGETDTVQADLKSLQNLRETDPAFLGFLVSPEMLTEHKLEFVETVFTPHVSSLVSRLLRLLVEKARINFLPEICREYQTLVEEHQGMLRAEVLSVVPLTSDQEKKLKSELDRITGKNVVLENKIEPAVLGGVVVHLGNQIIDRSLRYGIRRLKDGLSQVEVN